MWTWEFIKESFIAFNVNAFSSLAYLFMTNGWFFLIAIAASISMAMMFRDEVENDVKTEQQVL